MTQHVEDANAVAAHSFLPNEDPVKAAKWMERELNNLQKLQDLGCPYTDRYAALLALKPAITAAAMAAMEAQAEEVARKARFIAKLKKYKLVTRPRNLAIVAANAAKANAANAASAAKEEEALVSKKRNRTTGGSDDDGTLRRSTRLDKAPRRSTRVSNAR